MKEIFTNILNCDVDKLTQNLFGTANDFIKKKKILKPKSLLLPFSTGLVCYVIYYDIKCSWHKKNYLKKNCNGSVLKGTSNKPEWEYCF